MDPLAFLTLTILNNVMRACFQGFSNINVQKNAIKSFMMFHVFLKKVYNLAEKAKKIKIEFGKFFEK